MRTTNVLLLLPSFYLSSFLSLLQSFLAFSYLRLALKGYRQRFLSEKASSKFSYAFISWSTEVKLERSHNSTQTYEFMAWTGTNMPLLHFVLRLYQFLGYEVLIYFEFFIVFLSVMRKNSVLGGFKRLWQNCYRPHVRCRKQTLKSELSDPSETMLTHWGRGHLNCLNARSRGLNNLNQLLYCISLNIYNKFANYEGWNFNSGNYLFTTDTK